MALLRARESAMRLFRPMLANYDLTEQQWRVLRALTAATEPIEPRELAERTFLMPPSLSRILANLEGRRLINRTSHQVDQRRALISLSDQGRSIVGTVAPESELLYHAIEVEFGSERLQRLLDELHDLARLEAGIAESEAAVP